MLKLNHLSRNIINNQFRNTSKTQNIKSTFKDQNENKPIDEKNDEDEKGTTKEEDKPKEYNKNFLFANVSSSLTKSLFGWGILAYNHQVDLTSFFITDLIGYNLYLSALFNIIKIIHHLATKDTFGYRYVANREPVKKRIDKGSKKWGNTFKERLENYAEDFKDQMDKQKKVSTLSFKLLNYEKYFEKSNEEEQKIRDFELDLGEDMNKKIEELKTKFKELNLSSSKEKLDNFNSRIDEMISNGSDQEDVYNFIHKKAYQITQDTMNPGRGKTSINDKFEEAINQIISSHSRHDKVILHISSPGGSVLQFGQALSQLERIKKAGLEITCTIDYVAASGGQQLAIAGDKIYATKSAIVGSVGVITESPNLFNFLKDRNIDQQQITAGKSKRALNLLAEQTQEGLVKAKDQVERFHTDFVNKVVEYRPSIDIEEVSSADVQWGDRALELGLVDGFKSNREVLEEQMNEQDVIQINQKLKRDIWGVPNSAVSLIDSIQKQLNSSFNSGLAEKFKQL